MRSCRIDDLRAMEREFAQFQRLMVFRHQEAQSLHQMTGEAAHVARGSDALAADDEAGLLRARLLDTCAPERLEARITQAESTCAYDEADRLFSLLDQRASGDATARPARDRAFTMLGESRENPKRCSKRKLRKMREEAQQVPPPFATLTPEIRAERAAGRKALQGSDICLDPPATLAATCSRWQLLTGHWISPEYGGVIRFTLTGEDMASAYIVSASPRMRLHGYQEGAQVLRGWRFDDAPADDLRFSASQGEALLPGGASSWAEGGRLDMEKARPGILNLPETLSGPLSNHEDFIRLGGETPPG